jgi:hypothetical protein
MVNDLYYDFYVHVSFLTYFYDIVDVVAIYSLQMIGRKSHRNYIFAYVLYLLRNITSHVNI